MSANDCISYSPTPLELWIPSPIVFSTLCVSTDKTSLFIISLIRLILYCLIYYFLQDTINYTDYKTTQYVIITLISVNIMYIGIVVSKTTTFSIGSDPSMFSKTEGAKRLTYDTSSTL